MLCRGDKERYRRYFNTGEENRYGTIWKKSRSSCNGRSVDGGSVTGCSGAIDAEATVVTVGKEKVPLGVVNFYARMMQGQYETYYAGMMGTTAEELWTQDAGDDKTYEESVKDSVMEAVENMYLTHSIQANTKSF